MLIAFAQIPAIPAKFHEIFGEKHAIWSCSEQNLNFAKSERSPNFSKICEYLEEFEFEAVQRYVNLVDLEKCL